MTLPGRLRDGRTLFTLVAGVLWLAVTANFTLRPVGWVQQIPFWAFFNETMAGVDVVQNVVLFAPLGWIAHRAHWTARRTLLTAMLGSAAIEFLQQWVPGRTSTALDILSNTTGAMLGWWMATRAGRPRVRLAVAFGALAAFVALHVLNTAWPEPAESIGGTGAWTGVDRHVCATPALAQTVCVSVPNNAAPGIRYAVVAGSAGRTYARVQGTVTARKMARGDCVLMKFESVQSASLRLRPPLVRACALADTTDSTFELRIDPRLERTVDGVWMATGVGVWMWPVWPFMEYRPGLLLAAGALTFIIGAALLVGSAPWMLPAGYLLVLELIALLVGMNRPGLREVGWAAVAWLLAMAALQIDHWWRNERPN